MEIRFAGGRRVNASYDGFEIATDQSVKNGGEASAPEPFDLFLASIGTCAGWYVLAFCLNRSIPTDGIGLVQTWERDDRKRLTGVRLEIRVPPEFPEKYHAALVRAANQCTVKRTLEASPRFDTRVVVEAHG
jgi:ribosomal protein S12 methylthiotransferase accessory factor